MISTQSQTLNFVAFAEDPAAPAFDRQTEVLYPLGDGLDGFDKTS